MFLVLFHKLLTMLCWNIGSFLLFELVSLIRRPENVTGTMYKESNGEMERRGDLGEVTKKRTSDPRREGTYADT